MLPSRFRKSIDDIVDESYDIEDDLGPYVTVNGMREHPDKIELDRYLVSNISKPTLDDMANYMMEGAYYDEDPAGQLTERLLLRGGILPYPGNGKRYTVLDMEKFKAHEGAVSKGNDLGQGLLTDEHGFPVNAVEAPNWNYVSRPLTADEREAIKDRLRKNYEYIAK